MKGVDHSTNRVNHANYYARAAACHGWPPDKGKGSEMWIITKRRCEYCHKNTETIDTRGDKICESCLNLAIGAWDGKVRNLTEETENNCKSCGDPVTSDLFSAGICSHDCEVAHQRYLEEGGEIEQCS